MSNRLLLMAIFFNCTGALFQSSAADGQPYAKGDVFFVSGGAVTLVAAKDSSQTRLTPESKMTLNGIDVDASGTVFVTQWNNGNFPGAIHRLDPGSSSLIQVGNPGMLREPSHVEVMNDGRLLVSDPAAPGDDGGLFEIDPASGAQLIRYHGKEPGRRPYAPALDDAGVIYFLAYSPANGPGVFRLEPGETTAVVLAWSDKLNGRSFLVWDAGTLYATGVVGLQGVVLRFDPVTGAESVVSMGGDLEGPVGIAVHPTGCLIVVDYPLTCAPCCCRRKLLCIDPQTGEQGLITQYGYIGLAGVAVYHGGTTPAKRTTWGSIKARYLD